MLPVIDFAELDTPAGRERLREITHHVGFFYLDGHGVDRELLDRVFTVAREFFALPEDSKQSIAMLNSPHFRGYNRVGGELTNGETDWREQIDIGPERQPIPDADGYLRLQGPNQWPADLPDLEKTIEALDAALTDVGMRLLRHWAASLDADPAIFDDAFAHAPRHADQGRPLPGTAERRPHRRAGRRRPQGFGCTDVAAPRTRLVGTPGRDRGRRLDRRTGPRRLVRGQHRRTARVATGGYLRATRHRVLTPAGAPERLSVPYFLNPALDATVPTIELPPHLAERARGIELDPANPLYRTYGENAWKSRTRAHPDVYARWYPGEAEPE